MYPIIMLNKNIEVYPIFGDRFNNVFYLPMHDNSDFIKNLKNDEIIKQKKFNEKVFSYNRSNIIYSGFLEKRLRFIGVLGYEQMVNEGRYYHLGIDLAVNKGTYVFSPLDGDVYEFGYEEGIGNYGGYVILKHIINEYSFYSLYGHLSFDSIKISKGNHIKKGDIIGTIGDFNENGGYFHHLHLQIITEKGKENGFFSKGYCTEKQLVDIEEYTPNPLFIFRY